MSNLDQHQRAAADACVQIQIAQDALIRAADLMKWLNGDGQAKINEADLDLALDRLRVTRDSLVGRVLGRV